MFHHVEMMSANVADDFLCSFLLQPLNRALEALTMNKIQLPFVAPVDDHIDSILHVGYAALFEEILEANSLAASKSQRFISIGGKYPTLSMKSDPY